MIVRKSILLVAVGGVAATALAFGAFGNSSAGTRAAKATVLHDLWFELVGQLENSAPGVTPVTHIHYGYLAWLQGVSASAAAPRSEATAEFTFFADGKTSPAVSDGPLRMITRVGTLTIYRDPLRNSDFANPNTFRDGTRVLVAQYRHQPITSTLTNAISLFSRARITFTRPFPTGHGMVQLGKVGETFDEHYVGQGNMPGPPSGYFIGYDVSR
jgi:hypothetical protein